MTWPSGNIYERELKNDINGFGKYTTLDGHFYEGKWNNNSTCAN